jgi:HK97 gp10 family phage protein
MRYKMGRSIKITGIKELEAKLKKNATLDDARTVVKKNGAELQTLMTRNANFVKGYATGTTKRSIRCTFTDLNLTATVEPTTYYSPYLEYGTRFMSAQPFVRPSFNIQKEIFKRELKKLMK